MAGAEMSFDPDFFSIQVEEMSDWEAERWVRLKRYRERYWKKRDLFPDTRPMCGERMGDWECLNRAGYQYHGRPYCKLHVKMHQRGDALRAEREAEIAAFAARYELRS